MKYFNFLLSAMFFCTVIVSCDDFGGLSNGSPATYDVKGKVEKGPFISGSDISIQPMDEKLQVLGDMYKTFITDDLGNFEFGSKEFASPYAELMAHGYFFNEVKGELSNGTLTLRALVDLSNKTAVNVNILTHLKYSRIKNLVESGKNFGEADKQAQEELLNAFGLGEYAANDVSSFSITAGTDESAALIAISSLLLMERSEAAFTEYLSKLSADFGKNGKFSAELSAQIDADKNKLAEGCIKEVRENIIKRYEELGLEVKVKDLVRFVDWDSDGKAGNEGLKEGESVHLDKSVIEIPNEGGVYKVVIDSPVAVYLQPVMQEDELLPPTSVVVPQFPFSSFYEGYDSSSFGDKEINCECSFEGNTLSINVAQLQSKEDKEKVISLYDYVGNVIATVTLKQKGGYDSTVSSVPLLGADGVGLIASVAIKFSEGLKKYNVLEQYYAFNSITGAVANYLYPTSSTISSAWNNLYSAISLLNTIEEYDRGCLNVYSDNFNVLNSLFYSTLVYGWGGVPYVTSNTYDYMTGGIPSTPQQEIFADIKQKLLKAIENLPEKKMELNGVNFFYASKDVARVLLANIYMYEGDYDSARPLLEKVIGNGFYELDSSLDFKPSVDIDIVASTDVITDPMKSSEVIVVFFPQQPTTRANVTIMEAGVIPYITLSDVYLSLAECYCKMGDEATAEKYISDVVNAKKLNVTNVSALLKIKDVREKIRLYSGTYFAFLKRSGLAKEVCGIDDDNEFRLLFPIPEDEIRLNTQLKQNPGYE